MSHVLDQGAVIAPGHSREAVRLSARELEVLRLIADGEDTKSAADTLFISKRTVDFHLSNVYEKLGVSNRLSAVRRANRLGMLPF